MQLQISHSLARQFLPLLPSRMDHSLRLLIRLMVLLNCLELFSAHLLGHHLDLRQHPLWNYLVILQMVASRSAPTLRLLVRILRSLLTAPAHHLHEFLLVPRVVDLRSVDGH